jgi:prefoldin subunit 5
MSKEVTPVSWDKGDQRKVLISYCQRDHDIEFIAKLAYRLEKQKFDVKWDMGVVPPEDWEVWFRELASSSDFVIMVLSEKYKLCFEDQDRYQHHFKEQGSLGILPEIRILKHILSGQAETEIEPWKLISVFAGGKTYLESYRRRRRVVPLGLGGGRPVYGLMNQYKNLLAHLNKTEPPKSFGRKSSLGQFCGKLAFFFANLNEHFGRTLRSFGVLILSLLLVALTFGLYQYRKQIFEYLNVATHSEQLRLETDLSKHEKSLIGKIENSASENAAGIATLRKLLLENPSVSRLEMEGLIKNWNPTLNESTQFQQISNVQGQLTKFKTEISEIKTALGDIATFAELQSEFEQLDLYPIDQRQNDQNLNKASMEINIQVSKIKSTLTLIQENIDRLESKIGECKQLDNGETTPESQTFPSRQSWFFYNMARNRFFARDYRSAIQLVDQGLALGNEDARLYFLRGLANRRLGFGYEGDLARAIQLERVNQPAISVVNRSLERIQGNERLWLEEQREK